MPVKTATQRKPYVLHTETKVSPVHIEAGVYKVQSGSEPNDYYFVNVKAGTCTCIAGVYDFVNAPRKCRHFRAAVRASQFIRQVQKPSSRPIILRLGNSLITGIPEGDVEFHITVTKGGEPVNATS